jgi:hypothetical protein
MSEFDPSPQWSEPVKQVANRLTSLCQGIGQVTGGVNRRPGHPDAGSHGLRRADVMAQMYLKLAQFELATASTQSPTIAPHRHGMLSMRIVCWCEVAPMLVPRPRRDAVVRIAPRRGVRQAIFCVADAEAARRRHRGFVAWRARVVRGHRPRYCANLSSVFPLADRRANL